jgi:nifR3 family TIM-barrel protein
MRNCPKLYLAPMEGVATSFFRKAISLIGGFDECCTEFIRVPINANCKSLAKTYDKNTTFPIPQAAQIMGIDPLLLQEVTAHLIERGAPRIDLNCGCPSNVVTGKGAGSSLLKTPDLIYQILKKMKEVSQVPITAKIRSGYEDTSLLLENLKAVEESGADFITIHPRTKMQGYTGKADWNVIKFAKEHLKIPVVGNGDIETFDDVQSILNLTKCDAIMIGRGALKNPWIFQEIKSHFKNPHESYSFDKTETFIRTYLNLMPNDVTIQGAVAMLKQLFGYFFWQPLWMEKRKEMLRGVYRDTEQFLEINLPLLKALFEEKHTN